MAGQPTKMTPECLQLLREAFMWGCTDVEACCYAGIASSTLYLYIEKNPSFSEVKSRLKEMPIMKARRITSESLDDSNLSTAHKVIDRKEGQKITQDITSGGKPINSWIVSPVTTDKNG